MAGEGVDIATLGLKVDAGGIDKATVSLSRLGAEGKKVEQQATRSAVVRKRNEDIYVRAARERLQMQRQIAAADRDEANALDAVHPKTIKAAQAMKRLADEQQRSVQQMGRWQSQALAMDARMDGMGKGARKAGVGMGRLGESMVSVTRQATGMNPALAQAGFVLGGMGIGNVAMIGVLAGLAAMALALRGITKDAREAKEELEKQLDVLRDIAKERDTQARGGSTQVALDAGLEEAKRLSVLLQQSIAFGNESLENTFRDQLAEQNRLNREAMAVRVEQEEELTEATARELEQRQRNLERAEAERIRFLQAAAAAANEASEQSFTFAGGQTEGLLIIQGVLDEVFGTLEELNAIDITLMSPDDIARIENGFAVVRDEIEETTTTLREFMQIGRTIGNVIGGDVGRIGGAVIGKTLANRADKQGMGQALGGAIDTNQIAIAAAVADAVIGRTVAIFFGGRSPQEIERNRARILRANTAALEEVGKDLEGFGAQVGGMSPGRVAELRNVEQFQRGNLTGGISTAELNRVAEMFGFELAGRLSIEFADAIAAALEEATRQIQARVGSDFAARAADLSGNSVEAARIRREAAAAKEISDLTKLAEAGFITAAQLAEFTDIIGRELADALKTAQEAAEELARVFREDLAVRAIGVFGTSAEGARARLGQSQRREQAAAADFSATDRLALALIHQGERMLLELDIQTQAITDAANEQIAAIDAQLQTQRDALATAQDQLRTQEQTVAITSRVVDSLDNFSSGLLLSNLSPLSPSARLQEARAQFGSLSALALGGDVSAAESLPGAARALLDASQAFNASGTGFVKDFDLVQSMVEQVREQFAGQLTIEEQMLVELQSQSASLTAQIADLEKQRQAVVHAANAQIAAAQKRHGEQMKTLADQLATLIQMQLGIVEIGTDLAGRPRIDPNDWVFDNSDVVAALSDNVAAVTASVVVLQAGFSQLIAAQNENTTAVYDVSTQVRSGFENTNEEDAKNGVFT